MQTHSSSSHITSLAFCLAALEKNQIFRQAAKLIQNVRHRFKAILVSCVNIKMRSRTFDVYCFIMTCGVSTQEKHDRMKRFKRLTEMETAMCETVGEESRLGPQWQAQIVPSEEDLKTFRKRIEELEEIKVSLPLVLDSGLVV